MAPWQGVRASKGKGGRGGSAKHRGQRVEVSRRSLLSFSFLLSILI